MAPQDAADPSLAPLTDAIARAAHLLPAQGPITVFIHHNTLHAFEDRAFADAVRAAAATFGGQPYMAKRHYRDALARGRIQVADLEAVVREELGPRADAKILRSWTRFDLRLAMIQYPLRHGPAAELAWFMAETDALRRVRPDVSAAVRGRLIAETRRWAMRDLRGRDAAAGPMAPSALGGLRAELAGLFDRFGAARVETWAEDVWEAFTLQALWRVCRAGMASAPEFAPVPPPPVRHRDLLLRATGADADLPVHDLLVRFCAAFLDQGLAHWQLPRRDDGFFRAFVELYAQPGGPPDRWLRGLRAELAHLRDRNVTPLHCVRESLDTLGVPEREWGEFVSATLLALRGWAGITHFLEDRPDIAVQPIPAGSLVEFLAVRLLLDRLALAATARDALGDTGPLGELRGELRRRIGPPPAASVEQRAVVVFQLAQILGWTPEVLYQLDPVDWYRLAAEVETFSPAERHSVFHRAYERGFYTQALDTLALHNARKAHPLQREDFGGTSRFQAIFCLDEREESLRRHVEEVAPDAVTFGAAGFFGVAMYYRGAADAHFRPLCPIIIKPRHWVTEEVVAGLADEHERRARVRRAVGEAAHRFHVGSRSFALGAVLSVGVGVLASIPLVGRVLFPRLTANVRRRFARLVQAPPSTRLNVERTGDRPGYTPDEMADVAERQLRDIGLTAGFARLVFLIGHGSGSVNNPHRSAYDCGACGGGPGGPNARALAQMLNDPRVRGRFTDRGLSVPADTVFVGGFHNTCDDSLTLFDTDRLPTSYRDELAKARADLEAACERNAHERCRRFMSAPLTLSPDDARRHVEARAEDLAQTRPELGHATNALCVVGRRSRTRGLFLDRRAFLTSYDPTADDADATILTRILQAAVPVCAGINLEYYFSRVDSAAWGCGTKLPHNVAGLLGVMDGAASDLRTGLPWQMVEVHEPVRLLFVVETTPEVMLRVLDRNPAIGRLVRNEWVALATLDADAPWVRVYRGGAFHEYAPQAEQLPRAASSAAWFRGWREHLEFAEIG